MDTDIQVDERDDVDRMKLLLHSVFENRRAQLYAILRKLQDKTNAKHDGN